MQTDIQIHQYIWGFVNFDKTSQTNLAAIASLLQNIPALVSQQQNGQLLWELTPEEVKNVVFQLDKRSVAGIDGFTGVFFTHCWDIIGEDVSQVAWEFMCGVPIPKSIASTLNVLIPKRESPQTFSDFRLISVCTFIIKVFTKILYNRLKAVLPSIISLEQSTFVQGREMSDNILLAQELVVAIDKRVRGHNVILKLDMMKAFDRVSWGFLSRLLLKFSFHPQFVDVLMNNLTSSWFSILVNGKPQGLFQPTRGLKQSDPLVDTKISFMLFNFSFILVLFFILID